MSTDKHWSRRLSICYLSDSWLETILRDCAHFGKCKIEHCKASIRGFTVLLYIENGCRRQNPFATTCFPMKLKTSCMTIFLPHVLFGVHNPSSSLRFFKLLCSVETRFRIRGSHPAQRSPGGRRILCNSIPRILIFDLADIILVYLAISALLTYYDKVIYLTQVSCSSAWFQHYLWQCQQQFFRVCSSNATCIRLPLFSFMRIAII